MRLAKRPNGAQEQSASILDLLSFIGFSIFLFFKDLHNAIALVKSGDGPARRVTSG